MAKRVVTDAGFDALDAGDAAEAIRILEERSDIRLVFTDVEMPGSMDGLKLSHYLRDRWPPMKVIVVSGKAFINESLLPAGARFFTKPYRDATIVDAMISLLAA